MLYHYTSIAALKEILKNQQFRMTRISDFDDNFEFKYAILMVAKELSMSQENASLLFDAIIKNNKNVFVGCFCGCNDNLFLWRNYGDINIAFSKAELMSLVKSQQRSFGYISAISNFLSCEYHRERQTAIIKGALKQWKENDSYRIPVDNLSHLATFFKRSDFCTEQETRLVVYLEDIAPIKIDSKNRKHYWVLPFYGSKITRLIRSITIGPTENPAKVEYEIRVFLKKYNLDAIPVNHCKTSYEECSDSSPFSQKICKSCEWFMFPSQDVFL